MITKFNPQSGSVIVYADVFGPSGGYSVRMALDTSATMTPIKPDILTVIGYNLAASTTPIYIMTVSGVVPAPSLLVSRIEALGRQQTLFSVAAYAMPLSSRVDGLLGLNFLRGLDLNISFRRGEITLL